jgi:protein-tyrosine phosphatase
MKPPPADRPSGWPATLPPPRDPGRPYRVCLVCLGNICRSPMAEAVLRAELGRRGLGDAVLVDSAGTGDWHAGHRMDSRARAALAGRGYDGSAHLARQVRPGWLADRDLILAMDRSNLADLRAVAGGRPGERVRLFRSFDPDSGQDAEVPDPYYGEGASFGSVLEMIETAAGGLADELAAALALDHG